MTVRRVPGFRILQFASRNGLGLVLTNASQLIATEASVFPLRWSAATQQRTGRTSSRNRRSDEAPRLVNASSGHAGHRRDGLASSLGRGGTMPKVSCLARRSFSCHAIPNNIPGPDPSMNGTREHSRLLWIAGRASCTCGGCSIGLPGAACVVADERGFEVAEGFVVKMLGGGPAISDASGRLMFWRPEASTGDGPKSRDLLGSRGGPKASAFSPSPRSTGRSFFVMAETVFGKAG